MRAPRKHKRPQEPPEDFAFSPHTRSPGAGRHETHRSNRQLAPLWLRNSISLSERPTGAAGYSQSAQPTAIRTDRARIGAEMRIRDHGLVPQVMDENEWLRNRGQPRYPAPAELDLN